MSSALKANASEASKTQPTQASKPIDLDRRVPFTVDTIAGWLNATVLRTPFLLAIPALLYLYDQRQQHGAYAFSNSLEIPSYSHLKQLLFTDYKWIGRFLIFGLLKSLNHHLNRYFANLGEYRRDRPVWDKEVVVITGGSAGIGKAVVEVLSHKKRAKVAVLDMAPPTYAPAPPGAPAIQYYKVRWCRCVTKLQVCPS